MKWLKIKGFNEKDCILFGERWKRRLPTDITGVIKLRHLKSGDIRVEVEGYGEIFYKVFANHIKANVFVFDIQRCLKAYKKTTRVYNKKEVE